MTAAIDYDSIERPDEADLPAANGDSISVPAHSPGKPEGACTITATDVNRTTPLSAIFTATDEVAATYRVTCAPA